MKRTKLVLNEHLLQEAVALSGAKTFSKAVEMALDDFVRRVRARRILDLAGRGLWKGDLSQMRRDQNPVKKTGKKRSLGSDQQ